VTPYTAFYDDVLPEMPGCTTTLALHHIKRTCNDFYERSLFGREDCALLDVVVATPSYTAVTLDPTNFDVTRVLEVRLKNTASTGIKPKVLSPRSKAWLDQFMPDWDTQAGTPSAYMQTAANNVTLAYIPDTTYLAGLQISIAKVPNYAGAGIDDAVYGKFSESIALGIKARLMRMAKKPWTNDKMAPVYAQQFEGEVAAAAAIANVGYGRAVMRTRAWG
jgi:hypothetical protein